MAARQRSSYHHGDLRAALVAAGVTLLQREKGRELTLRAVARQAGVSPAAPYRHFNGVGALLAAIVEQGFVALREAMSDALEAKEWASLTPLERIGLGYVRFAVRHPAHVRLMFSTRLPAKARPVRLQLAGQAAFQLLVDTIDELRRRGAVDAMSAPILPVAAWALIQGLTSLILDHHLRPKQLGYQDAEGLSQACLTILRTGWSSVEAR